MLKLQDFLEDIKEQVSDLPYANYLDYHLTVAQIEIKRQAKLCEHREKK